MKSKYNDYALDGFVMPASDMQSKQGYVYVISYGNNKTYKIGYTRNLDQRLAQINCFNVKMPNELTLMFASLVFDAAALESLLHRKYQNNVVNGEWFNMDIYDLHLVAHLLNTFSSYGEFICTDEWFDLLDKWKEHGAIFDTYPGWGMDEILDKDKFIDTQNHFLGRV